MTHGLAAVVLLIVGPALMALGWFLSVDDHIGWWLSVTGAVAMSTAIVLGVTWLTA